MMTGYDDGPDSTNNPQINALCASFASSTGRPDVPMMPRWRRAWSCEARLRSASWRHAYTPANLQPGIRMRANVAEPEAVQSLAGAIGDRNAKRIMQIHSMPFRLRDGSLLAVLLVGQQVLQLTALSCAQRHASASDARSPSHEA